MPPASNPQALLTGFKWSDMRSWGITHGDSAFAVCLTCVQAVVMKPLVQNRGDGGESPATTACARVSELQTREVHHPRQNWLVKQRDRCRRPVTVSTASSHMCHSSLLYTDCDIEALLIRAKMDLTWISPACAKNHVFSRVAIGLENFCNPFTATTTFVKTCLRRFIHVPSVFHNQDDCNADPGANL